MAITYDKGTNVADLEFDASTHYALVEKMAKSVILNVQSSNKLDWFDKGKIANGTTIEQAIVNLATGSDWVSETQSGTNVDAPNYPSVTVKYFNEWNGRQFKTTVSEDQLRKVLMSGGDEGDVAQKIVSTLTEGENFEDYKNCKGLLLDGIQGATPNIKKYGTTAVAVGTALIKAIQDIVAEMQFVNTSYCASGIQTRTPFERIRMIMPYKIYNALNVDVLASIFNLEKAKLLERITLIDEGSKVFIVDEFGLIKYTRLYKATSRYVEDGLYTNYWLTVDRMYGTSPLFKMCYIETDTNGNTTKL